MDKLASLYKKIPDFIDLSILQGATTALIIKVLGSGVSFGLQIALAQILSLEGYGSYTYIMAWIGMISGFASLGFTTSLIRFIPEFIKKKEYSKLRGVIKTSILLTLGCSVLFALIGLFAAYFFSDIEDGGGYSFTTYLLASGILIGIAFTNLFGNIEKGKKYMFMAHAPSQLFKHLLIGIGIFLLWFGNILIDVQMALWITLIAVLFLVVLHLTNLKKGLPKEVFSSGPTYKLKEWLKVTFPLLLISGFLIILNRMDVIMLGILSSKAQVGIYNVAYKVSTVVTFILMAVNAIAAPTISELYHQNKMEKLQQLARTTIHLIFWPTLIVSILLVLYSDFILGLFGTEFIGGKLLLYILLISQLIAASTGCVGNFMNMTGYQNESAKIYGITALLNIIFNPIGIYFYGAVGAAVVTTISISFYNFWFYFLVKRKMGIKTSIF